MGPDACFARCPVPAFGAVMFRDCHLQEQMADCVLCLKQACGHSDPQCVDALKLDNATDQAHHLHCLCLCPSKSEA